jgi:hypothetical protein
VDEDAPVVRRLRQLEARGCVVHGPLEVESDDLAGPGEEPALGRWVCQITLPAGGVVEAEGDGEAAAAERAAAQAEVVLGPG